MSKTNELLLRVEKEYEGNKLMREPFRYITSKEYKEFLNIQFNRN